MELSLRGDGGVSVAADSDSSITRGLAAVLITALQGLTPEQIDSVDPAFLAQLNLGPAIASNARNNAFRCVFVAHRASLVGCSLS